MGLKRSFDEENLQELSFKHPKQLDSTEQLTSLEEINPSYVAHEKVDGPGGSVGISCEPAVQESKNDISNVVSDFNGKEFETSAPISWETSSISEEEEALSGSMLYSSNFPEYFDFPRRQLTHLEDAYSSSLWSSSPRKVVPLGPDHQADILMWDPVVIKQGDDDNGEDRTGICVMPMPDSNLSADVFKGKDGKLDCRCSDGGSIRCVQQHVKEARVKLKETIGLEKFAELGFFEMGEEVAYKWTEEEELVIEEVIYSNPVSRGKNFWEYLSMTFPSRKKGEIVSYYFNVFMLRRRATQNRCSWLEIDSDNDDEWMGNGGGPFGVIGEDEDSAVASFINQNVRVDHGDDNDDLSSDDSDDDDDDDGGGDGELLVGEVDAIESADGKSHVSTDLKECWDVQEDSCTSFECKPHMMNYSLAIGERGGSRVGKVNSGHLKFLPDGSRYRFSPQSGLEPCDAKGWDATIYSVGLMKSVDLLPARSMMEEIFGRCNWNNKSSNDKSIS